MESIEKTELSKAFDRFFHKESFGGVLLLFFTVVALIFANVPAFSAINDLWNTEGGIQFGSFSLKMSARNWINDGLMAIFFFVVSLEIKREFLIGNLSTRKKAALPVCAALGGMIFPALIYALFNSGNVETAHGWGIPMATDIAFAVGVMSLLGNRVPVGIKATLTALAVADDLGSIVVLAVFYPTHQLQLTSFLIAAAIVLFLFLLRYIKVYNKYIYLISGLVIWYFVYKSGVHATISGVLLALVIPSKTPINEDSFIKLIETQLSRFKKTVKKDVSVFANTEGELIIHEMHKSVDRIDPIMHKFEHTFHPYVNFLIMPLFALANAGVALSGGFFDNGIPTLSLGIFFGLLVGKPLGIFAFCWITNKLKITELPDGVNWMQILAMGCMAGIGFTMSIFIDGLAFDSIDLVNEGKLTILIASFSAAILGYFMIKFTSRKRNFNY